jgi:hypothetical protein
MATRLPHLERLFPALKTSGYSKSSEDDPAYNCFAFAVHDTGHNYVLTDSWDLEAGFEKVSIYVNKEGSPEHVSRQLESGIWTSKIGRREDIEHPHLAALEGQEYGKATVVMNRTRYKKK